MGNWQGKTVCVTGGCGMIGSHLLDELAARGCEHFLVYDDLSRGSLRNIQAHLAAGRIELNAHDLAAVVPIFPPNVDAVFHLAARVTSIEENRHDHWGMLTRNLRIDLNVGQAVKVARPQVYQYTSTACVTGDTRIYNEGHYKPISECADLHITLSENGYQLVTAYVPIGKRATLKVETDLGFSLQAATDHQVIIWSEGRLEWKCLADLQAGDVVVLIGGTGGGEPDSLAHLPPFVFHHANKAHNTKEIFAPEWVNEEVAVLAGYWLGDGSYAGNKQVLFCESRPAVLHYMNSLLLRQFGVTGKVVHSSRQYQLVVCSTQLQHYFSSVLELEVGREKMIPEWIWDSPSVVQGAFLRGLFEADGTVGKKNQQVSFTTVSEQLAKDVQQLLWKIGILSSIVTRACNYPQGDVAKQYNFKAVVPSIRYDLYIHGGFISRFRALVGFISDFKSAHLDLLSDTRGQVIPGLTVKLRAWWNDLGHPRAFESIAHAALYSQANITKAKLERLLSQFQCGDPDIAFWGRDDVALAMVESITDGGEQDLYDLTVANTHSYVSNGFVSHNCIYGHDVPVPTPEMCGAVCNPEPTNHGYGCAKWVGEQQARYLCQEHAIPTVIVRFFNAISPWRDYYDEATSHVAPALIRRVCAGEDPLTVWGTGTQSRVLVDARDLARALVDLAECPAAHDARPVNIGHEHEITIGDLALLICQLAGRENPVIYFDRDKPDGYPRRAADTTRLRELIGWVPSTPLAETLAAMIATYRGEHDPLAYPS